MIAQFRDGTLGPVTDVPKPKHPYCRVCGWRKGGVDSWDGKRCKCGHYEPPMDPTDPTVIPFRSKP